MSTAPRPGPFATKPTEQLIEAAEGTRLNRAVGALDLTALGIGAIIGPGIFVIIGEAIAESGPALVISFMLAGITCLFSALAYAELASSLPVRGFRVPLVPVFPLIGAGLCVYLMTKLPAETWMRFGAWLLLGLLIYVAYGYRHSHLRRGAARA